MKNKPKIIFFGTSEFAKLILEGIKKEPIEPSFVVTSPDKPSGRKMELTSSPVKNAAQSAGMRIFQPDELTESGFLEKLNKEKPDLYIVASYGKIIPKEVLDIPKKGALNVHPSLLPKWRGAAPIQYSLLNGEKTTGVTIMLMDEKMDHGPIVTQEKHEINPEDNSLTLSRKLAEKSVSMLKSTVIEWIEGRIEPEPQDHNSATYTKIINKEDGGVDWENKTAEDVENMLRAYTPWPGIFTMWNGKRLKIIDLSIENQDLSSTPGKVVKHKNFIAVQAKKGVVIPKKLQLEGKVEQSIKEFLNGHQEITNSILS